MRKPSVATGGAQIRLDYGPEVTGFIRDAGGRLYVWPVRHRCCKGYITLLNASPGRPPAGPTFQPVPADGFTVYLALPAGRRPDELHLRLRGILRRRVDAFWNGCAYLI